MKKLSVFLLSLPFLFSCVKTRNCECKTTWIDYTQFGPVEREEIVAYPLKGTKNDAKAECDIIKTNQNNVDGFYTACTLK